MVTGDVHCRAEDSRKAWISSISTHQEQMLMRKIANSIALQVVKWREGEVARSAAPKL